ncbi:MAG: PaaI family thioesterase, partial [bacterium]
DSSCGTAITQIMSGEEKVVTLDLRVQFLKPVTKGTLVSYGKVVHKSGRHVISECEVFDEEQALVARGSTIHAIIKGSIRNLENSGK